MHRIQSRVASVLAIGIAAFSAAPAQAASLQPVSNWNGGVSLPSDVTMYVYVPNAVATNPPILTLVHYCGGTASAVFGQAQGGGLVSAADKYGFIIVAPSSGRCWDVESNKSFTRDGGGDSHAIAQMVRYAITQYKANANRVYSTGDSSGGMMTELLLALYPDIFKGGSAFAGIPAGCRGTNETGTGYSGQCAGGTLTHTAAEWGTIVKNMYPGYTGYRPRVQMFHGDADGTISYKNLAEGVKEWSNILGLSATPTSTDTGLTLGTHKATRQRWQDSCGDAVLEAITSIGGDHGPSDALFNSTFVVPFLGLDQVGATDPVVAKCGSAGGSSGTGGASSTGGTTSTGGGTKATGGASSSATGGSVSAGGTQAGTGGHVSSGGASAAAGGDQATGGLRGSGGNAPTGGAQGIGGNVVTGGSSSVGGTPGQGGSAIASPTGGKSSTGTGAPSATGGSGATTGGANNGVGGNSSALAGDTSVSNTGGPNEPSGCSCKVGGNQRSGGGLIALALGAVLLRRRRSAR